MSVLISQWNADHKWFSRVRRRTAKCSLPGGVVWSPGGSALPIEIVRLDDRIPATPWRIILRWTAGRSFENRQSRCSLPWKIARQVSSSSLVRDVRYQDREIKAVMFDTLNEAERVASRPYIDLAPSKPVAARYSPCDIAITFANYAQGVAHFLHGPF